MGIITLTTDFGSVDAFVGTMKGVILGLSPGVTIVDLTHEIPRHGVATASFLIRHAFPYFPKGTIHVGIVDPGVGSRRRILLARIREQFLLAPDNGLITWLYRDFGAESLISVEESRYFLPNPSATFHGRDVFAPVAAHLVAGARPERFGPNLNRAELLAISHRAERTPAGLQGRVIHLDPFGNLVTNIHVSQLPAWAARSAQAVFVNGQNIGGIQCTFSAVALGTPAAMIGSADFLEIAVNQGRADERFGPVREVTVEIR